jgi:aminobenzoyl-glutamate utilization protein B
MKKLLFFGVLALQIGLVAAQDKKKVAIKDAEKTAIWNQLDRQYPAYCGIARDIWSYAELGFQEQKSAELLQATLRKEGFNVESNVAGMPTGFVATYGSGGPVIGILAEFDALPGLSQDSVPYRKPLVEGGSGHGCGHNLFGTASMAAAIALKDHLIKSKKAGTVKIFGTPAEEGGGGKVFMVREGLFKGVDAVLHWHPSSANAANPESCLAMIMGTFKFYGQTAHAAGSPDRGRSALDAAEAMNHMVNMMREHVPQEARIHYVIKNGGLASNVVPDYVEMEYTVRLPDTKGVMDLWKRVIKCAEGAAMGTETTVKYEILSGFAGLLPNQTLAQVMHNNLSQVGGVNYTEADTRFAEELRKTFNTPKLPALAQAAEVQPLKDHFFPASTDVGDVSWVVPTTGLGTATWVPGTAAHTWQATAADGMGIGMKGMLNAAKTIAATGLDLFNNPALIQKAKVELQSRQGQGYQYTPLIGDRKPPLDYRKGL